VLRVHRLVRGNHAAQTTAAGDFVMAIALVSTRRAPLEFVSASLWNAMALVVLMGRPAALEVVAWPSHVKTSVLLAASRTTVVVLLCIAGNAALSGGALQT